MTASSTPDNRPVIYIDDKDLEEGLKLGLVKVVQPPKRPKDSKSPKQYAEHCANRDFNHVAQALLLNLADRNVPKARLVEQVTELERLVLLCGDSHLTMLKRYRVVALKSRVTGAELKLTVIEGGLA